MRLRLPKPCIMQARASAAVREAGFRIGPAIDMTEAKGFPASTNWETVEVQTPAPMEAREAVARLARLCG